MKKIFVLIGSLTSGGAERVASRLAAFLVESGCEVVFITVDDLGRDFYSLSPCVRRVVLGRFREDNSFFKLVSFLRRAFLLRRLMVEEKPYAVVSLMTAPSILALLASVGVGVKTVVSERNYPALKPVGAFWGALRKILYKRADMHVVQTERIYDWLVAHAGVRRAVIIPNSIAWPLDAVSPLVMPDDVVCRDAKVLLAVGTKVHQKGFDLLLEVFSVLPSRFSDWRLVLVGVDGSELALSEELANRVHFVSRAGNMSDWYERASVFVLSSRYEGFPNVLLEAMSSGCACIAFDCPTGPSELIEHNLNGLLVSPGDVSEMTRGLSVLMDDAGLRDRLGRSAVSVRSKYSETAIFGRWLAVLEQI